MLPLHRFITGTTLRVHPHVYTRTLPGFISSSTCKPHSHFVRTLSTSTRLSYRVAKDSSTSTTSTTTCSTPLVKTRSTSATGRAGTKKTSVRKVMTLSSSAGTSSAGVSPLILGARAGSSAVGIKKSGAATTSTIKRTTQSPILQRTAAGTVLPTPSTLTRTEVRSQRVGSAARTTSAADEPRRTASSAPSSLLTSASTQTTAAAIAKVDATKPLPFLDFRTNNSREVLYTKDEEEANRWLKTNRERMFALDAEWRPFVGYAKTGKIAIVQLGDHKTVYLFHVIHMKNFPSELKRILGDDRVLKVGINIKNDGNKIFRDWGVECTSMVELGALCIQVLDDLPNRRLVRSMDSLTQELLDHSVEKVALTRMGNWESKNLTSSQLCYAANDVFVTYEIADKIKALQQSRPAQEYTIRLASIRTNGSSLITARGTLQERQDSALEDKDILKADPPQSSATATTENVSAQPVKKSFVRERAPQPTLAKKAAAYKKKTLWTSRASTATKKAALLAVKPALEPSRSTLYTDPDFFYKSQTEEVRAIARSGGRSVVTIIPPHLQFRRQFSSSSLSSSSDSRKGGEVRLPSRLVPESLEGKDILTRNQSIWVEAGGREDFEEGEGKFEDEDRHLRQNQALLESLSIYDLPTNADVVVEEDDWHIRQNQALSESLSIYDLPTNDDVVVEDDSSKGTRRG